MAQEIKDLIEKINQEGIAAAEEKAREIEGQAKLRAAELFEKSKKEAEALIVQAQEKIARMDEKEKALLVQAGRDLLLLLRKEINAMLERIVVSCTQQALTPEVMHRIIVDLIKGCSSQQKEDIVISLKKDDLLLLEKGFLNKLKEETKKGITLKPSEDVRGGFTISFDAGKSCYDFTDEALAEYIGQYLKPKLNEILKQKT